MLGFFLSGLGLALNAVAIPGPITVYLLTVAVRAGWRRALWVAISPLVSDIPVILIALFLLNQLRAIAPLIQIVGGLVLLWIAWGTWQQIQSGVMFNTKSEDEVVALEPREILSRSLLINLMSPGPYLFWGTVNGPLLLDGLQQSVWHGLAFLLGFYGTFFVGLGTLGFLFGTAGRINPRVTRIVMYVAVGLIVLFALQFIVSGVGTLFCTGEACSAR